MGEVVEFLDGRIALHKGDCREAMASLANASIDSVVSDPPYALTFMGKAWDTGETAFDAEFWRDILRVLKPGGHVVSFAGTRTYHRLACAIEDAGFEIRDQIGWCYGSGFPKSHDVSKGIDKASGELGHRGKKFNTVGQQGSLNSRPDLRSDHPDYVPYAPATSESAQWQGWGTALKPAWEPIVLARKPLQGTVAANVLAHGTGAINIDGCRVGTQGGTTAEPSNGIFGDGLAAFPELHDAGSARSGSSNPRQRKWNGNVANAPLKGNTGDMHRFGDSGSAARFFYTAKADADDRLGSKHPTVKPIDLMRYLCRLVTPPGGVVLDPFAGTGTTGEAAFYEGFRAVLCERETEYQADIARRMKLVMAGPAERLRETARAKNPTPDLGPLFG